MLGSAFIFQGRKGTWRYFRHGILPVADSLKKGAQHVSTLFYDWAIREAIIAGEPVISLGLSPAWTSAGLTFAKERFGAVPFQADNLPVFSVTGLTTVGEEFIKSAGFIFLPDH